MPLRPLRRRRCRDDPAVVHLYDAMAVGGGFGIVRDHEDGLSQPLVQIAKKIEHYAGVNGIEISCGLIG